MALSPLDLMEPEETVGKLWHDFANQLGAPEGHAESAVTLTEMRPSLTLLFRALGGSAGIDVTDSAMRLSQHRLGLARKLGTPQERLHRAEFDGERLGLPPVMDAFPDRALNRSCYLWLAALAVRMQPQPQPADPLQADLQSFAEIRDATARVLADCPGLASFHRAASRHLRQTRSCPTLPKVEAAVEAIALHLLGDDAPLSALAQELLANPRVPAAPNGYLALRPVPIWLTITKTIRHTDAPQPDTRPNAQSAPASATRKAASREDRDQANRKDSFILHRFEAILSWVESMNLNRSIDDDDADTAAKAAEDQDRITLSRHDRKVATKLRLHLDLSPQDADHERLAGTFTYPEWNHRSRSYMDAHVRVLVAEADSNPRQPQIPGPRLLRHVRRQFEALRPRRVLRSRQIEGAELDLDALISAQVDLRASGWASDRIYLSQRQIERDLSVAFLLDTSRSTESAVGDTTVIDIAREGLAALAGGIDACGDRLGIWGFSSLKRDRVFLKRCKGFDVPMTPDVITRICGLTPCHYTRLGAAIRHASAMLAPEPSARKLLLVLTDGKPNDLDHYEGIHGIEDSHMAVREARRLGQAVHGIIIDRDGQDWFARIFGRGGFTLLPDASRLTRALPDIYRTLTEVT